jgi:prepilin-type N-terminal cleavage/methylation domain-containing protein
MVAIIAIYLSQISHIVFAMWEVGKLDLGSSYIYLSVLRIGHITQNISMARSINNNLGFTLVEMLTVVIITGILAAIAMPSLYKNKSFANTVPQIESTFKIVSLKARANSGNPYRITLITTGTTPGTRQQILKIDYALNNNCTPQNDSASITAWEKSAWRQDPIQTLSLPNEIEISNFPNKGFCFNGKGEVFLSPGSSSSTTKSFDILSTKSTNSKATKATINISVIGDVDRTTYDSQGTSLYGKFN